jgi:hypothetical protein
MVIYNDVEAYNFAIFTPAGPPAPPPKIDPMLKLNAREKTLGAGEKLEDFETQFRIKWCPEEYRVRQQNGKVCLLFESLLLLTNTAC